MAEEHGVVGQSGAVLVVQRTSSDRSRSPHVHAVFLDGVHQEVSASAPWTSAGARRC